MNMRLALLCVVSLAAVPPLAAQEAGNMYHDTWVDFNKNGEEDPFENPDVEIEKRVADLVSRMTLDEKTMQMVTLYGYGRVLDDEMPQPDWKKEVWKDGLANIDEELNGLAYNPQAQTEYSYPHSKHAEAINTIQRWFVEETRLGIPVDFTNEGIRGLTHDRATSFPAQIGVASTWNQDLVSDIGRVTGREARALGYTNIYSPILDLSRDPRWGRTVETYGEDPFLVKKLGTEMVKAIQSEGVASTPKHFAVYSVPKGGRDGPARTDPHVAKREMLQMYLMPFRAAFQEADAMGTMSSYNDWNGVPVSASNYFLTELLREKWGFDGYVVSDSRAVDFVYSKHHVAPTYKDAVRQVVEAGLNVRTDFNAPANYVRPLRELVREGELSMETINSRVSDVLRVKFKLGLFDQPYVEDPEAADRTVRNDDALETAQQVSRESMVLLKNEDDALPLNEDDLSSVLVAGPMADAEKHSISRYGPSHIDVVSVLEGIREQVGGEVEVTYEKGVSVRGENWPESDVMKKAPSDSVQGGIDAVARRAAQSDVAVMVLGGNQNTVGESRSRTSLNLPGHQLDLLKAVYATGTPVVLVLVNGRPLTVTWADRYVPAILEAWFPGEYGGTAVAETLFGDYNPGGKLPITFPLTVGQIPFNFPYKPGSQGTSDPRADRMEEGEVSLSRFSARVKGALYPFGHGLSYTTFAYDNLRVSPEVQRPAGTVDVSFDVTNTGERRGDEIVQLYLNDETSSVITYEQQLRGFERVSLAPGETKSVSFTLTPKDLRLLDRNMEWTVEPGRFNVLVGSSSTDIQLQSSFRIAPRQTEED